MPMTSLAHPLRTVTDGIAPPVGSCGRSIRGRWCMRDNRSADCRSSSEADVQAPGRIDSSRERGNISPARSLLRQPPLEQTLQGYFGFVEARPHPFYSQIGVQLARLSQGNFGFGPARWNGTGPARGALGRASAPGRRAGNSAAPRPPALHQSAARLIQSRRESSTSFAKAGPFSSEIGLSRRTHAPRGILRP
jgi:hypothetical protein